MAADELYYVHIRPGTSQMWDVGQVIDPYPDGGYWRVVEVQHECLVVVRVVLDPDAPSDRRRGRVSPLAE